MKNKPRLAIVGASARAAAFSALGAGFDVVTADLFADADLRRRCPATRVTNYPDSLADWLALQEVDAWMYTGALENYPDLVDRMARVRPLWGNSGEALRRARDPFVLQRELAGAEVLFPETRADPNGLPLDGSWLGKTYRNSNGAGVWRVAGREGLDRARDQQAVFQAIVRGNPLAAAYVLDGGTHELVGLTRQLVGDPRFGAKSWAYCGSVRLEEELPESATASLARIGKLLAEAFHLRGVVGVDLIVDGERLWLIEVNPRFAASMELIDSQVPLIRRHAECFAGPPAFPTGRGRDKPTGKGVLYAKREARITQDLHDWAMADAEAGRLADIPPPATELAAGDPVLTVLVDGPAAGAVDRLAEAAARVESRLYA